MKKFGLFAIGTPVLDGFAKVDEEFIKKHKLVFGSSNFMGASQFFALEKELKQKVLLWEPGDNSRNVCEGYARLEKINSAKKGMQASSLVAYGGAIGQDWAGARFLESIKAFEIEPIMQYMNGETGRVLVLVSSGGQRTFAVFLGVGENYFMPKALPECKFFFLTSITLFSKGLIAQTARNMIGMMKKAKANIAISLESPAMLEKNRQKALEIAKYADVLFLNDEEMKAIGVNEKTICNLAPLVYLKKGKDGSAVFSSGSKLADIPPYPAKVIDTTGAGDAYAAGVLWALNNTKSEIEAGVIGSKLAAAVISKFGAGLADNLQEII